MNEFLEEIFSQPQALLETFEYMKEKQRYVEIRDFFYESGGSRIIFTGMGSSYFSCFIPYYFLNKKGLTVEMREAGEFLLYSLPEIKNEFLDNPLVIMISQSGESEEIRQLLIKLQSMKIKPRIIGITNDSKSNLASFADFCIFLHAGKEASVTSKSYVCTLLVLYLFSLMITNEPLDLLFSQIKEALSKIKDFLSEKEKIDLFYENLISFLGYQFNHLEILSRGSSLATAHQAALNYKEIVKKASEASPLSSFRHGGIESLTKDSRLIIISSDETNFKLNVEFMKNLVSKWEVGKVLHITNRGFDENEELLNTNPKIISFKHDIDNPYLSPIMEIIILQLLFFKLAEKNGLEPGKFRFSEKITREI